MVRTPTVNIDLDFKAPAFRLPDTISGTEYSYDDLKGDTGTVVMFICNHCPFVVHVLDELIRIGKQYIPKGIGFIVINSNDVKKHPMDSPQKMKELALVKDFPFPYLYDESQEVAKAYFAACTPDLNVFDKNNECVYRGQLDASRPGNNIPVTGKNLMGVLDKLISGDPISTNQTPSVGCNIKWKAGNEPAYY